MAFSSLCPFQTHLKRYVVAMLGLVALATPWSVRCSLLYKRLLFLPSMGQGISLYDTTEPWAVCFGFRPKAGDEAVNCRKMQTEASKLVEGLDKLDGDRHFGKVGLQHIFADPLSWLKQRLRDYPIFHLHKGEYFWLISQKTLTPLQQNPTFAVLIQKACLLKSYLRLAGLAPGLWWA